MKSSGDVSNMKELIVIGAGDFGREMVNVAERINTKSAEPEWKIAGFVDDDKSLVGTTVNGYPVLGDTDWLNEQRDEKYAICSVALAETRNNIIKKISNPNIRWATLIDPDAHIYKNAKVGDGSLVCGGSILAIGATVGNHVIVNLSCTLGHDCVIGNYSVINPGVNISGKVTLDECVDMGTGAKVIHGISIGANTTIGAGGVVIKDIAGNCVAVGCPVKVVKYKD